MADSSLPTTHASPSAEPEDRPAPKKRKLRKGTASCWDCKRRKVRCEFEGPTSVVCNGCKRRGTKCTSQEYAEEPETTSGGDNQVGVRLRRVESLLEHLTNQLSVHMGLPMPPNSNSGLSPLNGRAVSNYASSPSASPVYRHDFNPETTVVTAAPSAHGDPDPLGSIDDKTKHDRRSGSARGPNLPLEPSLLATVFSLDQSMREAGNFRGLSLALFRAWPSQRDLDSIHSITVNTSGSYDKTYTHHRCFLGKDEPLPRDMLQHPPMGQHPVMMARKHLSLATYLQGVAGLNAKHHHIMSDMIEAATRLVTSNDELVRSLEGIECIILESLYHHNEGNFHRAWLATRRAMTIAQIMGLYRQPKWSSLKVLEPETRRRIKPGNLWFRIVHLDRYLSLMLGLPQGSSENSFATPEALESCDPFERLERKAAVAAGRILQIRDTKLHDLDNTNKIDELLLEVSESMPTEWWPTPDFANDESMIVRKSIRIMGQVMHFNLLAHLHLPYILDFSHDPKYDYNRVTAAHASRELLLRYVWCSSNDVTMYHCKGLNFHAFIASTALCLAHIYAHQCLLYANSNSSSVLRCLMRHRRSDHNLIKRVLKGMEQMASTNTNPTVSKISTLLKHLLIIEAESASGIDYNVSFSQAGEGDKLEYGGEVDDSRNILFIHLPHFGIIKTERSSFPGAVSRDSSSPKGNDPSTSGQELYGLDTPSLLDTPSFLGPSLTRGHLEHYNKQSQTIQSDEAGHQIENVLLHSNEEVILSQFDTQIQAGQQSASAVSNNDIFTCTSGVFHNTELLLSGPMASIQPLARHEIDMAIYNSLDQEKAVSDVGDEGNWIW